MRCFSMMLITDRWDGKSNERSRQAVSVYKAGRYLIDAATGRSFDAATGSETPKSRFGRRNGAHGLWFWRSLRPYHELTPNTPSPDEIAKQFNRIGPMLAKTASAVASTKGGN